MTPQERIKADAEAATEQLNKNEICGPIELMGFRKGYIAGATAENSRAQVLVDALEAAKNHIHDLCMTIIRLGYTPFNPISEINEALAHWKGKEVEPTPQPTEPQPDLGTCVECKTRPATTDYNGHQHYVCKLCDDSLNREFDEEYR